MGGRERKGCKNAYAFEVGRGEEGGPCTRLSSTTCREGNEEANVRRTKNAHAHRENVSAPPLHLNLQHPGSPAEYRWSGVRKSDATSICLCPGRILFSFCRMSVTDLRFVALHSYSGTYTYVHVNFGGTAEHLENGKRSRNVPNSVNSEPC